MVQLSVFLTLLAIFSVHLMIVEAMRSKEGKDIAKSSANSQPSALSRRTRRDSIEPNECYFSNNQLVFFASKSSELSSPIASNYLPFVQGTLWKSSRFLETSATFILRPDDKLNTILVNIAMNAVKNKFIQNHVEFVQLISSGFVQNAYSKTYSIKFDVNFVGKIRSSSFTAQVIAEFILTRNAETAGLTPGIINFVICRSL